MGYLDRIHNEVADRVNRLDLGSPQCGFPWYKVSTLEHQIVAIRHTQHHAAILSNRLLRATGLATKWVSSV
ncbi:MAG: hypothetical protein U0794_11950 [Isosphaeraceae bacterium]